MILKNTKIRYSSLNKFRMYTLTSIFDLKCVIDVSYIVMFNGFESDQIKRFGQNKFNISDIMVIFYLIDFTNPHTMIQIKF